ncbi:kinase-like protein [Xylariaceae sp. FL1272]|nr:kinase-like protein [Xylariaceae sp. FL1272]
MESTEVEELTRVEDCHEHPTLPYLEFSELLGPPPYVLDPETLEDSFSPFSDLRFRQVDEDTLVKYGKNVTLAEAEAMDFVSRNTRVKVPKVIGAYKLHDYGYILMSFEPGKRLADFWECASLEQRESVISTLQYYLADMRALKASYVGGFNRSPCVSGEFEWDSIDKTGNYKYGPYSDEQGFNDGLVDALQRAHPGPENQDPESEGYNRAYRTKQLIHSLRGHDIVFTHGDLHTSNILVQDHLSVVILDWYTAGFYPAYWEWYKATWHGVFEPSFIRQVERFIPPYWIEANIMQQIFDKIVG